MMVPEPTHSVVQIAIAGLSATILSVTGVTFHGLMWAMFGAIVALMFSTPQDRGKALASIVGGMLCGAVLADLLLSLAITSMSEKMANSLHLGAAFIIGGGARPIFYALIDAFVSRAKKAGGDQ